jgi:hypothetical protein
VAARGSLVAVSAWKEDDSGEHVVRVFEGSGAMWRAVRVVGGGFRGPGRADGQLHYPLGLRFTGDGTGLAVAEYGNHRVSVFRVEDGSFARHVATGLSYPWDVEECEGGWLVACSGSHTIKFVGGDMDGGGVGRASLGKYGGGDGEFEYPSALALVPGLGLVVRDIASGGRLQFFATPDAIAMASMSPLRVVWMAAVARGTGRRRALACKVTMAAAEGPQVPTTTAKRQRAASGPRR